MCVLPKLGLWKRARLFHPLSCYYWNQFCSLFLKTVSEKCFEAHTCLVWKINKLKYLNLYHILTFRILRILVGLPSLGFREETSSILSRGSRGEEMASFHNTCTFLTDEVFLAPISPLTLLRGERGGSRDVLSWHLRRGDWTQLLALLLETQHRFFSARVKYIFLKAECHLTLNIRNLVGKVLFFWIACMLGNLVCEKWKQQAMQSIRIIYLFILTEPTRVTLVNKII